METSSPPKSPLTAKDGVGRNTLLGLDKEQKIRGANASSLLQKLCKGRYSHFFSGKAVAAYTGVEST